MGVAAILDRGEVRLSANAGRLGIGMKAAWTDLLSALCRFFADADSGSAHSCRVAGSFDKTMDNPEFSGSSTRRLRNFAFRILF